MNRSIQRLLLALGLAAASLANPFPTRADNSPGAHNELRQHGFGPSPLRRGDSQPEPEWRENCRRPRPAARRDNCIWSSDYGWQCFERPRVWRRTRAE